MKKVALSSLNSIFGVNRPNPAWPRRSLTLSISESTEAMDLKFQHNGNIPFKMVVSDFQPFSSISLQMVVILVNLDFRTIFDIFSPITQKSLRFSKFSSSHVEERWNLV